MKVERIFVVCLLVAVLLGGVLAFYVSHHRVETMEEIPLPILRAYGQNSMIVFLNQDAPKGLHFNTGPSSGTEIIADGLQRLQTHGYPQSNPLNVDVNLPLEAYRINNIEDLLTSGNLSLAAQDVNHNPNFYSVRSLMQLMTPIGQVKYATDHATTFVGEGVSRTQAVTEIVLPGAPQNKVPPGAYETREVDFNFLGSRLAFIWFKPIAGGMDWIYPNLVYPDLYRKAGLQPGILYTLPDFIATLQKTEKETPVRTPSSNGGGG